MQPTPRKTTELKQRTRKEPRDEARKDEKLKKGVYTISAPRDFVQKSTTADIYAQKKKSSVQSGNAPKKVLGSTNTTSNVTPMKGLLKSSASSISQKSVVKKIEPRNPIYSARKNDASKKQPLLTNVTVNSPTVKRKLDLNSERREVRKNDITKETQKKEVRRETSKEFSTVGRERQRTKTRTLDESEVKILVPEAMDNNAEMLQLTQKLVAKPKSFYIDLDEDKTKSKPKDNKSSDEEVSYEDDFESYESDFDSYHSDPTEDGTSENSEVNEAIEQKELVSALESSYKDGNEEKMLDSGNFDLRDRSAKTKAAVMDFIIEKVEDRKTVSLTDEGFQDMSSASAGSSMKNVDVLDRPVFLDFTKAKQNKLKRKLHERLKQRAEDLLSIITLHEMSYSLFEMQPISYDLYMATFGRSNYTQSGVQTFDDGITTEVQTEEVSVCQKWTQNPVEFSKKDIYLNSDLKTRKYSKNTEDYLTKFTFLLKKVDDYKDVDKMNSDENYKTNPLRIYLEQKDGAGGDEMLPYETYKTKIKSNSYNTNRLGKFLKKFESSISQILSKNTGDKDSRYWAKSNKIPFSKGYISLSSKMISDEKLSFLRKSKIIRIIFSETKPNLILTVHKNAQSVEAKKSLICLWDLSAASAEPTKVLTAIDDVTIGRFRGSAGGLFVAALEDGSIHLWDLSEEPTWRSDIASYQKSTEFVEVGAEKLSEFERDREWNLKNRHVTLDKPPPSIALQSCAYTNSAYNMSIKSRLDAIVGLEINADVNVDARRRVVGQIISLQRIGALTIWSIIQEKFKTSPDMGKAFASKIKLEKCQTIQLTDHISKGSNENLLLFNLNAAKKRILIRKQEKNILKKQITRPQSAISWKFDFDIDRPSSAASMRKRMLPVEINVPKNWETGVVCGDLKIMRINNVDNYLIAKNCGEVLLCKRCLGAVKIERFVVTNDTSSVTSIEVSSKGLPYFLAATDTGTVNLCSLLDNRVLLTLDCRNVPSLGEKCQSDHKGRYISSVSWRPTAYDEKPSDKLVVKSVNWSSDNPCRVFVVLQDKSLLLYELTHSDIYAKYICENSSVACSVNDINLALLTPEGEVQVHRLTNESRTKENLTIFEKYVALL